MNRFALAFIKPNVPKFVIGSPVITRGAKEILSHDDILAFLKRHSLGDWGDLDQEDITANEEALRDGGRLFSKYHSTTGEPFYVITEADRSVTTILLPEEY